MLDMPNEQSSQDSDQDPAECVVVSTSNLSVSPQSLVDNQSHWKGFMHMLKKGNKQIQIVFNPLTLSRLSRKKSRSSRDNMIPLLPAFDHDMYCIKSTWKNFSLKDLHLATNNFSRGNNNCYPLLRYSSTELSSPYYYYKKLRMG